MTSACSGDTTASRSPCRVRAERHRSAPWPGPLGVSPSPRREPGDVGEPVPGRAVVQPLFGQVAGVGLGDRSGLDRGQRRGELLDPGHHLDQLVVRPRRPQRLGQAPAPPRPPRPAPRRAGAGGELRDRHTNIESVGTDIPTDIHRVYPTIRDHPQKRIPSVEKRGNRHHKEHLKQRRTRSKRPEVPQPKPTATTLLVLQTLTTSRCASLQPAAVGLAGTGARGGTADDASANSPYPTTVGASVSPHDPDDPPGRRPHQDPHPGFPVDSDVTDADLPTVPERALRLLRTRRDILLVIALGGALGAAARYGLAARAPPLPRRVPLEHAAHQRHGLPRDRRAPGPGRRAPAGEPAGPAVLRHRSARRLHHLLDVRRRHPRAARRRATRRRRGVPLRNPGTRPPGRRGRSPCHRAGAADDPAPGAARRGGGRADPLPDRRRGPTAPPERRSPGAPGRSTSSARSSSASSQRARPPGCRPWSAPASAAR